MEKSVSVITNALFEKLPHDVSFYTRDGLVQCGLPSFLVKRIVHLVYKRIIDKLMLPDSDWLDRDSGRVAEAWSEMADAIRQEARIPANLMKELLSEAVLDCIELTVYPRKAILKFLFMDDDELDISAITERAVSVTVNRYLVWSLIRYMEKKEKRVIDRNQADQILAKIDEKVVENYHPLNWLALVKPLYELCGPNVPSNLLRLFFEDKKQQPASREFDLLNREINETEFIEVLSSPDLLYVEGYNDDQQKLFEEESEDDLLEDPLNQKFMSHTDDLPEILPVEDETDVPDSELTEEEHGITLEAEQSAPWDEDESETDPEEESDTALSEMKLDQDQDQDDVDDDVGKGLLERPDQEEMEDSLERAVADKPSSVSELDDKEPEPAGDEKTLASRFIFDDDHDDTEVEVDDNMDEATTIYDELNLSRKSDEPTTLDLFSAPKDETHEDSQPAEAESPLLDPDLDSEEDENSLAKHESATESPLFVDESDFDEMEEKGQDDADLPMWRSFLEREDVEESASFQFDDSRYNVTDNDLKGDDEVEKTASPEETDFDEDAELLDEDGFIEEPIYDLTREEEPLEQKIGGLTAWLQDEKERFIIDIFGDSEDAYDQALSEIIEYDDWKSASRYIEKEIFTRNRIDVYDEIAVDFTDRLHSYFLENKP